MSIVLVLSLWVGAPAPQDPQARALELYDEGRFAEAAVEFEALARQGDPKQFFEAGQMRFAAGHMAHASRHFQAYIASGLDEEQRSIAQSRMRTATAGTRRVEARVTPSGAAAEVVARRVGDPPEQQRPELSTPVVAGTATLRLDPGAWELHVAAPGFVPVQQALEVGETNAPVTLVLVPVPVPATVVTPPPVPPGPRPSLRPGRTMTAAGAVLLPLGLVALGGFVATTVGYRRTGEEYRRAGADGYLCDDLAALGDLRDRARSQAGAMVGLGVVSGALLVAGTVLLVRGQKTLRRTRLSFDLRPGRAGLLISGSF